jgi:ATP-dependent protease ClpP protease subunit
VRDQYWGSEKEKEEVTKKVTSPMDLELSDNADFNQVDHSGNRIYFYSGVSRPKVLKMNKLIFNLNYNLLPKSHFYDCGKPVIKLHINSYGGSVFAGLSAVDHIINSELPIHSVVDGCAASAATLMSIVADKRYIQKNACMLVHQLSGVMWGKYAAMRDDMENSKMLMKKIKNIYREYTKIPEHKMNDILKHDLWWDAEKCLEYGLVDEII